MKKTPLTKALQPDHPRTGDRRAIPIAKDKGDVPDHKEQFNALLRAAAQKRELED